MQNSATIKGIAMQSIDTATSARTVELGKDLEQKIRDRTAKVGVIGLGHVGLLLAMEMARERFQVTGIDIDSHRVESVNAGISYILDVPSEELFSVVSKEG